MLQAGTAIRKAKKLSNIVCNIDSMIKCRADEKTRKIREIGTEEVISSPSVGELACVHHDDRHFLRFD